ncbi:hypothetical protein C8J43_11618 [Sphingomonas sp. PP-CE-1G-424]|nr:hypothetical protein C8J43_11618 [Sphingomonas sp. PP-CE-1G-424]
MVRMEADQKHDVILNEHEAALHWGVTPELLFNYTRARFAQDYGFGSLQTVDRDGRTCFSRNELDRFSLVLSGPWSATVHRKPAIPTAVIEHLMVEARNECARCHTGTAVENAHIIAWAISRSHHHDNLVRVCSNCHTEHDLHRSLSPEQLRALKDRLVARTRQSIMLRVRAPLDQLRPPQAGAPFFGRIDELERLETALSAGKSILVCGAGGIGKSELVAQGLARMNDGRPVLWLDVERFSSVGEIMGALRTAVGPEGVACSKAGLPAHLDLLHARVVLDGVERSSLDDIDGLEDAVRDLFAATRHTQLVTTSQLSLYVVPAEVSIALGGLNSSDSRDLLGQATARAADDRAEDLEALVGFCDGHALTLRIAGALMDAYGGSAGALAAIRRHGAAGVRIPGRRHQNRRTSLEECLDVAYAALDDDVRTLLWALSNAPGGVYTFYLDEGWLNDAGDADAVATLRRWHLTRERSIGDGVARLDVLAPVRHFAIARAQSESLSDYLVIVGRVVQNFESWVAVMELQYDTPEATPYVLDRYADEVVNLLHVLHLASGRPDDKELVRSATGIVRALMRYFFVRRLHEQGAYVMREAARLAIGAGLIESASDLAMQTIVLAQRTNDRLIAGEGLAIADQVERATTDERLLGDVALCRSMVSLSEGAALEAEASARIAFQHYRHCLQKQTEALEISSPGSTQRLEERHNAVASALSQTGFALLALGRFDEAAIQYRHALQHQRGTSIAVNEGQTKHQLANCESHLGNHEEAARLYLSAARTFLFIQMEEYLGHALSELGHTLVDIDPPDLLASIDAELVSAGLANVAVAVSEAFTPGRKIVDERCFQTLRSLSGIIYLAGLAGHGMLLEGFAADLRLHSIDPLKQQIEAGILNAGSKFLVMVADRLLAIAGTVAAAEGELATCKDVDDDLIFRTLGMVCGTHSWLRDGMRLVDWTGALLSRRWGIEYPDASGLREFIYDRRDGVADSLEIRRRS